MGLSDGILDGGFCRWRDSMVLEDSSSIRLIGSNLPSRMLMIGE